MTLTTISIQSTLWTNHDDPGDVAIEAMESEPGAIDVERTDANEVAVHFRHGHDTQAMISAYVDRAGAVASAEVLRAAAEPDTRAGS